MITISRATAHTVRTVLKRAFGKSKFAPIWLRFLASAEGLRIQAVHDQVAIEYRLAEPQQPEEILLPLDLLTACESKKCSEPVRLRRSESGATTAEWLDKQIPQQQTGEVPPEKLAEFPPAPTETLENGAELLAALAAACDTTDDQSSRYALGCINLRGKHGSIAATDGSQLLVQGGWTFPWQDDVLVPGNRVFNSAELTSDRPVQIGRAGDWVVLTSGPWTVCLRVQKDARFPQIDDMVRNPDFAKSRLTISPADAGFALDAIKRLPVGDDDSRAVTLDLNCEVLMRARPNVATAATEVHLANSQLAGEALRLVSDRKYLQRALALGFTHFSLMSPTAAFQANDGGRHYIWMPWDAEGAVPADVDTRRVTSPLAGTGRTKRTRRIVVKPAETVSVATIKPSSHQKGTMTDSGASGNSPTSPIEQVTELRSTLQDVLTRTNDLLRTLKRQRKQSRLVETTLQSLKQLQQVA